jgi:hypothetical protein
MKQIIIDQQLFIHIRDSPLYYSVGPLHIPSWNFQLACRFWLALLFFFQYLLYWCWSCRIFILISWIIYRRNCLAHVIIFIMRSGEVQFDCLIEKQKHTIFSNFKDFVHISQILATVTLTIVLIFFMYPTKNLTGDGQWVFSTFFIFVSLLRRTNSYWLLRKQFK